MWNCRYCAESRLLLDGTSQPSLMPPALSQRQQRFERRGALSELHSRCSSYRKMTTRVCVGMPSVFGGKPSFRAQSIQMNVAMAQRLQMIRIIATSNVDFQSRQLALFEGLPLRSSYIRRSPTKKIPHNARPPRAAEAHASTPAGCANFLRFAANAIVNARFAARVPTANAPIYGSNFCRSAIVFGCYRV